MTNQPETAVTVDALARMLSAADVEINHGDYPTWDTLAESGQKQYRQAARYLLKRLHITTPAAVSAAVAPPTQAAVLSPTERAMLTYALDQAQEHIWSRDGFTDEDQAAIDSLRRMADETATETPEDPARIDRLRPEFTEHASVEAIDAQLDRARRQERRWHIRAEWLIGLRQARADEPAVGARQDGAET